MNTKIPFTKDIPFDKKVCEITSISLEHELKVEDNTLKGNFIVSGDFKSHEISVNKEPFSYILPFEIDLASEIDTDTIEFMIDDFTYEIKDNSILRVNIDFSIVASMKEKEEEKNETIFEDASVILPLEEERVDSEENTEITLPNEIEEIEIKEEVEQEKIKEEIEDNKESEREEKEEMQTEDTKRILEINATAKEENETINEETIINNIKDKDDEYTTYHIHMVSDGETVETICTMYNSNINILSEYNDLSDLSSKDKIIIPEKDE